MFRSTKEKFCFHADLKLGCYIIASFSVASYIALGAWIVFNTMTMPLKISLQDPDAIGKLTKVLIIGQFVFPVVILLMKYNIILLIGLNKESRFLINLYLVFAKYAFTAFIAACITYQFHYPMDPYANVATLFIPVHASFLYAIRTYWRRLEPKNPKTQQHIV